MAEAAAMDLFPKRLDALAEQLGKTHRNWFVEGHDNLALGVRKGNAAVIELVAHTHKLLACAEDAKNLLHMAARKVDEYNQMRAEHVKLVAKMNATVKTVFTGPVRRNTPLMDAVRHARADTVAALIADGHDGTSSAAQGGATAAA